MRRRISALLLLPFLLSLTGCSPDGSKTGSLSVIYAIVALLSLLLLVGYCLIVKKKNLWFLVLFASVMVVNIGYFALAISRSLDEALLANRLAYLGSVFLPLSMWMIIADVSGIRRRGWLTGLLLGIGVLVFLVAASPGYSTIYYKEVFFQKINGVAVLKKVYGPLHLMYMVYLLGYFTAMVVTIIHATLRDKIKSPSYAAILALAVFVNIGVWLIEQLVRIDFEILSVSYIITECFLLGLHLVMAEAEKHPPVTAPQTPPISPSVPVASSPEEDPRLEHFLSGISRLTPKEQALLQCYISGMSTAEIMEQLSIKENTLKFHNKNLYGKLGVSSRKELLELHKKTK